MDRPSQRSTPLDPTTPDEPDPASPDPEEPNEGASGEAPPDSATSDGAVPDASLRDGAVPDGATPDGATPDGATPDGATPDGATPDGATPDSSTQTEPAQTDATQTEPARTDAALSGAALVGPPEGESPAGDVPTGTASGDGDDQPAEEASGGGTSADQAAQLPAGVGTGADSAAESEEAVGGGAAFEAEPVQQVGAEADVAIRAEPVDGEGDGHSEMVGDGKRVGGGDADGTGDAGSSSTGDADSAGDAHSAEDADRDGDVDADGAARDEGGVAVRDRSDGESFAPPHDVQVIALALVEAATEDAARVSPAPTAPTSDLAPDPAPVVPPFPMPLPPGSSPRETAASARAVVVQRARDLRAWWTGVGPDGERAADGAATATRNRRIGIGAAAAVVVLLVVYAITAAVHGDVVPKGTTVAGAEVGGQSTAEAAETLAGALAEPAAKPVELVAGEASTTLDPIAAGLAVDVPATADSLTGFSLSPARVWRHLFGAGPAAPVLEVDDEAFAATIGGLEDSMAVAAVDGAVAFAGVTPTATPAQNGTRIDPRAAARAITSAWLVVDGPVELPTLTVPPEITQEETDAALAEAEKIVSGPVAVSVGGQQAQLPPKVLAAAASFVVKDGGLAARFDGATLTRAIVERTDNLLTMADGAQYDFASGRPKVIGGELGTTLADGPTRTAIRTAALGDERTATLKVVHQTPENSTQALRAMGVEEVVAEFSTPLTSDYVRTQNLIRGAEMITGDLIRPGETFSLVSALSPITLANGYVASGMIIGGQHIDGVGGGLSQMATTTYSAAMIAGFEDVEHHPHSYWFERYPAGREATIAVGSKDMKVRNNTPYGAVLQSWVADNQLHVRIWSTKFLKNTWTDGEKRNIVPPGVVTSTDAGCLPYPGGEPGFTITVDRLVERISDGKVVIEQSYTTTYRPDHGLACVTPEPPEPPEPDNDTAPTPPGPDG
ncbi:VanW family protein [Myceligenerans xiligouense]|uniref:Vancomycin resistance protein YoaR n=1 Tax=Myceligenerans xiligouense TaxID=253184 RepID=A0A3N4Z559_9MICO|nr:VanW family protein [Myceligenerans xiligouense]RPF21058.1 vancomycin resistance protein YoaR [Myceligenerans xiligouense]